LVLQIFCFINIAGGFYMSKRSVATGGVKGGGIPVFGLVSLFSLVVLVTYLGVVASRFYYLFDFQSWSFAGWFAYLFFYLVGPLAALAYFQDFYPAVISIALSVCVVSGFWLEGKVDE